MAKKSVSCPVETAIEVIGGRWKVLILQELFAGTRRFSELHRALGGVSHRTLTQQLRELESHGILRRKVHRQIPPKVEYSLTRLGETLKPVIEVMHDLGRDVCQCPRGQDENARTINKAGGSSRFELRVHRDFCVQEA